MKLIAKILLWFGFCSMVFQGCSQPDEPESDYGGSIIGTWKSITKDWTECFTFNNDGTGEYVFASYYKEEGYRLSTRPMTWELWIWDDSKIPSQRKKLPYDYEKGAYLTLYNVDLKGDFTTQMWIKSDTLCFVYHYNLEKIQKPKDWYAYLDRNAQTDKPKEPDKLYTTAEIALIMGIPEGGVLVLINQFGLTPDGVKRCTFDDKVFCDAYNQADLDYLLTLGMK